MLNKITRKNRLALLLISKILDWLIGATHLLKVDLKDAYYYILVVKRDC